jgi:hypothetical protein
MKKDLNTLVLTLIQAKIDYCKASGADFESLDCKLYLDSEKRREILSSKDIFTVLSTSLKKCNAPEIIAGFELIEVGNKNNYIDIVIRGKSND